LLVITKERLHVVYMLIQYFCELLKHTTVEYDACMYQYLISLLSPSAVLEQFKSVIFTVGSHI